MCKNSLYDICEQTIQEGLWKRFDDENISILKNILKSNDVTCWEYVIDQILAYNSKDTMNESNMLHKLPDERIKHSLLIYFIGCYLYYENSELRESIDEQILTICDNYTEKENRFNLAWMLIALYHDVGYVFENESYNKKMFEERKIKELCNNGPSSYSLLKKKLEAIVGVNKIESFYPFDVETIRKYDIYRRLNMGSAINPEKVTFDHGIYGGICLYKDLIQLKKDKKWKNPSKLFYATAAWTVICHNIWFAYNKADIQRYRFFGLDELLIKPKQYRITLKDQPLLFLLDLVDNIECIKKNIPINTMKNISIELKNNKLSVEIKRDENLTEYAQKILDLDNWLLPVELRYN